jgi:hypothetical protein
MAEQVHSSLPIDEDRQSVLVVTVSAALAVASAVVHPPSRADWFQFPSESAYQRVSLRSGLPLEQEDDRTRHTVDSWRSQRTPHPHNDHLRPPGGEIARGCSIVCRDDGHTS